jgi:tetratricopeptide (TPR) repeat protein
MTPDPFLEAVRSYRAGDLTDALVRARHALALGGTDLRLHALAGLIAGQMGDPAGALPHLKAVFAANQKDLSARINLANATLRTGDAEGALALAGGHADIKLRRIAALADQQLGNEAAAIQGYQAVTAAVPSDFESWNNLGNLLAAADDLDGATSAFERAIAARSGVPVLYLNYSKALNRWDRHAERQKLMREAAWRIPDNADIQCELGLAEASTGELAAAEKAFRTAIRLTTGFTPAYIELGLLLESVNRIDDLAALVDQAKAAGLSPDEIGFVEAWSLRRQGRWDEAEAAIEAVPPTIDPARRYQLLGEIKDRLGKPAEAFDAFRTMNRTIRVPAQSIKVAGGDYFDEVRAAAAVVAPERVARWHKLEVGRSPAPPAFIVGFPRSGTTLTDTLLMNLADVHVLEELPVVRQVQNELGDIDRVGELDSAEANRLRARYFAVLNALSPPPPGARVIDKFPLHMARIPLIHRIFPDAPIVFVERHPCDCVLSCFMSNFQPNRATIHFRDIVEAARLYDQVFDAWTRAEAALPLRVHRIRYERMIDDLEGEMRPLLSFLEIPWDDKVLDNQGSAARRDKIRTASYSQVTEPIYRRSLARWQRYRAEMADALPILTPWAERLGYEM